jgi:predicted metalloprotease
MAGTWAHSVFEAGLLQPGDLEEATNAALAVGDFDVANKQHHGTPEERRAALLTGYDSGEPSRCNRFVTAV